MEAERPAEAQLAELFCCGSGISAGLPREQRDAHQRPVRLVRSKHFQALGALAPAFIDGPPTATCDTEIRAKTAPFTRAAAPAHVPCGKRPSTRRAKRSSAAAPSSPSSSSKSSSSGAASPPKTRKCGAVCSRARPRAASYQGPAGPRAWRRRSRPRRAAAICSDDVELVALGEGQAVHGANGVGMRERLRSQRLP